MKDINPSEEQKSSSREKLSPGTNALNVTSKITLLSFSMVALTVLVLMGIVIVQKSRMAPALGTFLDQQALEEADKLVKTIRDTCAASEAQSKRQVDHSLGIARDLLAKQGAVSLDSDKVVWEAENQVNHQKSQVTLPKFIAGSNWLGQSTTTNKPSPVVDETRQFTRSEATIYQRMNEGGDMLAVCTSLVRPDGSRAVGSYLPSLTAEGTPNPIINTVLKGETYHGRAQVQEAWYDVAYEPIWDSGHQKVIGMLFAGVNMTEATRAVRESITKVTLGRTGFMFVLGAKGDSRGHYIISQKGEHDGASVWDSTDLQGKPVGQEIVKTALANAGRTASLEYTLAHPGESTPRKTFAAVTYYEPWDWVIGACGHFEEYQNARGAALNTLTQMLWMTAAGAAVVALIAFGVSYKLSRSITHPLNVLAETADRVAKGDNSIRVSVTSTDEIGQLGRSFNSMLEARIQAKEDTDDYKRLQEGIQQLLQVTSDASDGDLTVRAKVTEGALGNVADAINLMLENVGDLLQEVQTAANRVATSATEIQAASEELSQGSVKQTGEIINTTAAVQEMASNIESVSNNATSANEAAVRARQAADVGAKAVQQVIEGMQRIRQNVQAGAKKMKRLGERSMEISAIINTISQISAQTDMLALNAAIEAARAGEHGRGFTVVAEEVRKLAERTAAATKEIEKLIAGIQAETNESVSAMEQQTAEVEQESKVVASTGSELGRIRESSVMSAELINEINLAAKQQVRGAGGVVKAMETVSAIAQQAQSGASQTKRATESLAQLSSELLSSLGKFKINTNGHGSN